MRTVRFAVGTFISLILQVGMTHQRTNGEYCHAWKDAQSTWREGFHCPERNDQREAVICCGACGLRYCCTLMRARLDQGNCNNHEQVQQPGTSDDKKVAKSAVPVYVPFVIVGSLFLAFIFLGSMVAMGVCLSRKQGISQSPEGGAGPQGGSGEQQQEAVPMTGTSCGSTSSLYPPNASQACPTGSSCVHQTLEAGNSHQPTTLHGSSFYHAPHHGVFQPGSPLHASPFHNASLYGSNAYSVYLTRGKPSSTISLPPIWLYQY